MTKVPYRAGQEIDIEVDGVTRQAKVETYRIINDRQIMTVRDHDGNAVTLTIKLPMSEDGAAPILIAQPDMTVARKVALATLSGVNTRLPVAAEANLLAAAVVALTGGAG